MDNKKLTEDRKAVSRLIYLVLTEKLHVKDALLKFPKDITDESLKATYNALIHYEADEDLRKQNIDYREEQDDYLEFIAQLLDRGEDLPSNIIEGYKKYYKDTAVPHSDNMKGLLKSLCRFLNI